MAAAVLVELARAEPDRPRPETIAVTMADAARAVPGAWVMTAGWPDPDIAGMRAAAAVEGAVRPLGSGDRLVLLLSDGAEALVPAPVAQLPLADFTGLDRALRKAGAGEAEALLVRQQLSRLEGGGLLALALPAEVEVLAMAPGAAAEDLRLIGGGLAARPLGSTVTARALVELYGLWRGAHKVVRRTLSVPPAPPPWLPRPRVRMVGANALSVAAMLQAAPPLQSARRAFGGGSTEVAHDLLAAVAGLAPGQGIGFGLEAAGGWSPPSARFTGGLAEDPGGDGEEGAEALEDDGALSLLTLTAPLVAGAAAPRLAEHLLRFLCLARDRRLPGPWVLALSGSGAGGQALSGWIVGSDTLARAASAGLDPDAALARGGAAAVLDAGGERVVPGRAGAEVGDLGVFLRG